MFFRIDADRKINAAGRRLGSAAVTALAAIAVFAVALFAPVTIDRGGENVNIVALKSANAKNDKDDEHANPWRVVAAAGSGRHRSFSSQSPRVWHAISVGLTLEPYAEVETGADGWLELSNGYDQMSLAPNTVVALPHPIVGVPDITILQSAGQVYYEVESRRGPSQAPTDLSSRIGRMFLSGSRPKGSFEVHTPYLVATVKGTTFGVSVSEERALVSVTEGVVRVAATAGGGGADVNAGDTAMVEAAGGVSVGATSGGTDSGSSTDSGSGNSAPGNSAPGNSAPGNSGPGGGITKQNK